MSEYAGDVTPQEAWEMVRDGAVLVDVRTVGEWEQIGVPDTSELGVETHFIEWVHAGGVLNPGFRASELESIGIEPGTPIVFLCRSGSAAMARRQPRRRWASARVQHARGFEGTADARGARAGLEGRRTSLEDLGDHCS